MIFKKPLKLTATLLLFLVFLWHCQSALEQLSEQRIGVEVSYQSATDLVLPDITVCPAAFEVVASHPFVGSPAAPYLASDDIQELMMGLRNASSKMFVKVQDENVTPTAVVSDNGTVSFRTPANLFSFSDVASLSMNMSQLWGEHIQVSDIDGGRFLYCLTYIPPKRAGLGVNSQITFQLKVETGFNMIYFSHGGRNFPSATRSFDSEFVIPSFNSEDLEKMNSFTYGLTTRAKTFLSRKKRPCTDDSTRQTEVLRCFHTYLERILKCKLPIKKNGYLSASMFTSSMCRVKTQLSRFLMKEFQRFDAMNDEIFLEKTGCVPLCRSVLYEAKLLRATTRTTMTEDENNSSALGDKVPNMELKFYFTQPEVQMEKEYRVYTTASFIAEVGGYLGLFLGFSMLSIYEWAADLGFGIIQRGGSRKEAKMGKGAKLPPCN